MAGEVEKRERSMRSWMELLERRGELGRIHSEIEGTSFAAVLERADGKRAVSFSEVRGSSFPLVGNLLHHREHVALAMSGEGRHAANVFARALDHPKSLRVVPQERAPVLANQISGERLLSRLPLAPQHEHDGGDYIAAGLLSIRDPRTGRTNLSINRMLAVGERELRAFILPNRLAQAVAEAEAEGRDLDVAIVVGVHPSIVLASQAPAEPDLDDLEVASALGETELRVVETPGVDATVPAEAEFVIEGRFRAGAREKEGPFGEFPLTYSEENLSPVIDVVDVWHRDDAVFQTILSGGREHFLAGGIPLEAALLRHLRRLGVNVSAVRFPESASGRFHAVIAIEGGRPAAPVQAMMAAFASNRTLKQVTIVDSDVDVMDDDAIGWAVATRVQADRDVHIYPWVPASTVDPSSPQGTGAKLGIDATIPPGEDHGRFTRMRTHTPPPGQLAELLCEAGLQE